MEGRLQKIKEILEKRNNSICEGGQPDYPIYDQFIYELNDNGHIDWLVEEVDKLQEYSKDLIAELRNLKAKKWFIVYQENLKLIDEIKILTKELDDHKAAIVAMRFSK